MYKYKALGNDFNHQERKNELLKNYNLFPDLELIKSYTELDKLFFKNHVLIKPYSKCYLENIKVINECKSIHFLDYQIEQDFYWYKKIEGETISEKIVKEKFDEIITEKESLYSLIEKNMKYPLEFSLKKWFINNYFLIKKFLLKKDFFQLSVFLKNNFSNLSLIHGDFNSSNILYTKSNWIILDVEDLQYGIPLMDKYILQNKYKKGSFNSKINDIELLWVVQNIVHDITYFKNDFRRRSERYLDNEYIEYIEQRMKK